MRGSLKPSEHQPRIHIFRRQLRNVLILLNRAAQHALVDAALLAVAGLDLLRENSRQQTVGRDILGIIAQRFLGVTLRLAQAAGTDVEFGKFLGQQRRRRIRLDGVLIILDCLVQIIAPIAVGAGHFGIHVRQGVVIIG